LCGEEIYEENDLFPFATEMCKTKYWNEHRKSLPPKPQRTVEECIQRAKEIAEEMRNKRLAGRDATTSERQSEAEAMNDSELERWYNQ
jgi:hypothetical protein